MPGFEIKREQSDSYGKLGHRAASFTGYVKLDESAEELLGELKGARLSFFMCVAIHEAAVCVRGEPPYTFGDIVRVTKCAKRALQYALPYLLDHNFVVVAGTSDKGEKMFRPSNAKAWFGDRAMQNLHTTPPAYAKTDALHAKTSSAAMQKLTSAMQKDAITARSRSRSVPKRNSENKSTTTVLSPAQKILKDAGWFTVETDMPDFDDEAHARTLAKLIADNPKKAKDPASYVRACVLVTPTWGRASEKANWFEGNAWATHGTRSHAEYIRANPGSFDCGCEEDYPE